MKENEKLVGEEALNKYNTLIKNWFETKVNEVTYLEPVYHAETRTLEFVEKTSTASE